jgi:hypothetical protein
MHQVTAYLPSRFTAARVRARGGVVAFQVRAEGSLPFVVPPAGALANRTAALGSSRSWLSPWVASILYLRQAFYPALPNLSVKRTPSGYAGRHRLPLR